MRFANPKNEVAFSKIFDNKDKPDVLISFLNAALDLQQDRDIQTICLIDPNTTFQPTIREPFLLETYATDARGEQFIVKIQMTHTHRDKKRFTYSAAIEYASQIQNWGKYRELMPIVFIHILDFNLFQNLKDDNMTVQDNHAPLESPKIYNYLNCHKILNTNTYAQEFSDIELYFIELPKFEKQEDILSDILDKWIYFIKHGVALEMIPKHVQEPELRSAYALADLSHWNREDLAVYEYRQKKIWDEHGAIEFARRQGYEIGRKQAVAERLLSTNLSIGQIAQATNLSIEQVQQLQPEVV